MPDVSPHDVPAALAETDAQRADRLTAELEQRNELLALVGHELRNPLHALTLQLTLMRAAAHSAGHEETQARAEKSLRMLGRYADRVTVLLDLMQSPTQSMAMANHSVDTDLCALVRTVNDNLSTEAQYRGVDLQVATPDSCRACIDPQWVEQMVDNLVINALKHAAARSVVLTLHAAQAGWVRIDVSDDGRGIAEADRDRIFGKFGVGQNSHRGTGTGLGLWIVTRLATALGGAVDLQDRPQGGSIFTLTIPVSARSSRES